MRNYLTPQPNSAANSRAEAGRREDVYKRQDSDCAWERDITAQFRLLFKYNRAESRFILHIICNPEDFVFVVRRIRLLCGTGLAYILYGFPCAMVIPLNHRSPALQGTGHIIGRQDAEMSHPCSPSCSCDSDNPAPFRRLPAVFKMISLRKPHDFNKPLFRFHLLPLTAMADHSD